ncbi:hypothetical protein [Rhizobium sp. BR 314]
MANSVSLKSRDKFAQRLVPGSNMGRLLKNDVPGWVLAISNQ